MALDRMRWRPDVPEEDETLRPHYQREVPLPMHVRANDLPLDAPEDDPLAYLEEELERRFGRSYDPSPVASPGAPPRPQRGYSAPLEIRDETQYIRADLPRPRQLPRGPAPERVREVTMEIVMEDGLVHRIRIERPMEVYMDQAVEEEEFTDLSMLMNRMETRRGMREITLRVLSPRSWEYNIGTNRPPSW